MKSPKITVSVLPDKRAILSCSLIFARTCSTSNVSGIMERENVSIKKETMRVTSTQSEQKQTMKRLHISTCAVHRFDLFT